jgi:hypothetical protein
MAPILPDDVRARAADLLAGRAGLVRERAERWVLTAEYDRQLQLGWVAPKEDGSHRTSRQWFYPRDDHNWEELLGAARLAIDLALLDGKIDPAVFWLRVPAPTAFLPGEALLTARPRPQLAGRRLPAGAGRLLAALALVAPLYIVLAGLHDDYTLVPDTARELWTVAIAVGIAWAAFSVGGLRRAPTGPTIE